MPSVFAESRWSGRERFRVGPGAMGMAIGHGRADIRHLGYFGVYPQLFQLSQSTMNSDFWKFTSRQQMRLAEREQTFLLQHRDHPWRGWLLAAAQWP